MMERVGTKDWWSAAPQVQPKTNTLSDASRHLYLAESIIGNMLGGPAPAVITAKSVLSYLPGHRGLVTTIVPVVDQSSAWGARVKYWQIDLGTAASVFKPFLERCAPPAAFHSSDAAFECVKRCWMRYCASQGVA